MRRWVILYDGGHGRRYRVIDDARDLSEWTTDDLVFTYFRAVVGIHAIIEVDPTKEPVVTFWGARQYWARMPGTGQWLATVSA